MKRKTALITGASRGIGRAIVILLANRNMNVILNYNQSQSEADQIVQMFAKNDFGNVLALKADVSQRNQVDHLVEETHQIFGDIDVLVNNAGVAEQKLFSDILECEWDRMFDVNVKGMFNCTQAVLPDMIKNKSGKIINISSIWGIVGASCEVHYSASKAAVIGFTKALAKELGPSNINVNCVAPGVIQTDMLSGFSDEDMSDLKLQTPLGVVGKPSDVADIVDFLISDKADFITGQVISPNGGFVI